MSLPDVRAGLFDYETLHFDGLLPVESIWRKVFTTGPPWTKHQSGQPEEHDMARLMNDTRRTMVAEELKIADGIWSRLWGLMGRKGLPDGSALLIVPSSSVHTMFMRFAIDVVFLDRSLRVTKVVRELKPYRLAASRGAHSALEMPAGSAARAGIEQDDQLRIVDD